MNIPVSQALSLLHRCSTAVLASHSQAVPGYPFATVLPFAPGPDHSPWFLMSSLAEHCRNAQADPRVSLLLQTPTGEVLQQARMTLVGELQAQVPDAALQARLLRYCPDFEQYLALGDFSFYRLSLRALRFIGGFGQMGWVQPEAWQATARLELATEASLLPGLVPPGEQVTVLGADSYGVDYLAHGQRQRLDFGAAVPAGQLLARARAALAAGELR
ncbi:pyridoxamine 5'-phosphate oxidase family protein [Vogesella sp. DC21W]|uniref:Pyridoxamine 5'-phosphate oxidase family protein n=1 Tax=Vogesella aquatica TaxID=2984206 RepID=A0ABT5IV53_9NEIS|nr:pyridoxamine 5'-phosphate oxidase family protein [Vogesella aquatica]MDC7716453.1 pyridoxamine 5'-phosphate oxidase family protein [Vogesella aquatica]